MSTQTGNTDSTGEDRTEGGGRAVDDRGISITLNYVLVLGISATLVAGLLVAGGTFVEDQRERVIEDEMNVVGNHIAGDIEQVDRMVDKTRPGGDKPDLPTDGQRDHLQRRTRIQPGPGGADLELAVGDRRDSGDGPDRRSGVVCLRRGDGCPVRRLSGRAGDSRWVSAASVTMGTG